MAELLHRPQARRTVLGRIGWAGAALLLGACEIIPDPGAPLSRPEPVPTPAPRPIPTPTPVPPPAELRNRVALLVPLTGENGGVGTSIANAARLALLDSGDERIRLTVYDTARGAGAAAAQALAEGNRLFLGPLLAEDVRAVAPAARRADVPVIAFSNDVSVAGNGVYLMGFNPGQSIERVVRHARAQGLERFAGLVPNGLYGQRASQAMIRAVEGSGGRMVAMQAYDRSPSALRAAVVRLNGQSGYDAVLVADAGRIAATAVPTVRNGPSPDARLLGTELWKTEANLPALTPLRGAWFAAVPEDLFAQLRTRYRARYGASPYRLASLGYDGVLLSVRVAAGWPFGTPFPESALRDPQGFEGVDGAFRFGADGVAERALEVQQVDASGLTTVSPAPRAVD